MTPETTATIRAAYEAAIPALEAIEAALTQARDDEDAEERRRAIVTELSYARMCERALKREKAVEVACDRRHTSKLRPTRANIERAQGQ